MKLITLNDRPELKEVFCQLSSRILPDSEKSFALKPEYVSKILDLKFPVPSEAFLLESSTGEYCGRILLQGSVLDKTKGHFGLFCLSPNTKHQEEFEKLWPEIEGWFKYYGINNIIGPYLYTTFFPYRFRADQDSDRFAWEPNQPKADYELFKKLSFADHETYFTNFLNGYGVFETKGTREYEEALKMGFKFRPITQESLEEDVKILYDLSMTGFTDNYLFAPIPFELFKSIYAPSFKSVDMRLSCIQEDANGKPAGFNFTFISDGYVVIKTVCTAPEFRGKGLFNAGLRYGMMKAMELFPNVKNVATALIHEDNGITKNVANQTLDRKRHDYVLVSKDLK